MILYTLTCENFDAVNDLTPREDRHINLLFLVTRERGVSSALTKHDTYYFQ